MFDATFFVALAFIVVVGVLIYLKMPQRMMAMLDAHARDIANELERARQLRMEAETLRADYQAKQAQAEAQAKEIITIARENAVRMAEESRAQLQAQLARRTAQAETKIAHAQAQSLKDIRAQATALAISAARQIIADNLGEAQHDALVDKHIQNLENQLH